MATLRKKRHKANREVVLRLIQWTLKRNLWAEIDPAEGVKTLAEKTANRSLHASTQWDSKPKPQCQSSPQSSQMALSHNHYSGTPVGLSVDRELAVSPQTLCYLSSSRCPPFSLQLS